MLIDMKATVRQHFKFLTTRPAVEKKQESNCLKIFSQVNVFELKSDCRYSMFNINQDT